MSTTSVKRLIFLSTVSRVMMGPSIFDRSISPSFTNFVQLQHHAFRSCYAKRHANMFLQCSVVPNSLLIFGGHWIVSEALRFVLEGFSCARF